MRAWSLNYRDILVCSGRYGRTKPGLVPLSDGAGEVVEVGADVAGLSVGDRVAGTFFTGWQDGLLTPEKAKTARGGAIDGLLAESVVGPENSWVKVPESYSFEEAATLPCAALTAWTSLFEHARLVPGQTVLLQGTGGVSIFGLQIAKAAGLRAIVTSSSDEKLERARTMGADALVNYTKQPDWDKAALEITDGEGVDAVLEVGGAGTLARSLKASRYGGTVCIIGVLAGIDASLSIGQVQAKNLTLRGVYVGSRVDFQRMNAFLADAAFKPVIDRTFAFEEAKAAIEGMAEGKHFGKIVVTASPG
jgi:NADPH:quinone reductase-like Zn-dependent oxidoreductase